MSTIVAVRKNGKAVIAADTLSKFGSAKQDRTLLKDHSKICRAGSNYLAFVGDSVYGMAINDYFRRLKKIPLLGTVEQIFHFANKFHSALKEDYFLNIDNNESDSFEASGFEILIGNESGIFGLYSHRTVDEFEKYFAFGSGAKYALGALHSGYDQLASPGAIAEAALKAAAFFDDSTGLPVEIHEIELKKKGRNKK